ncbi:DUF4238 domain-containing protein [Agromyces sp. ZXT2-6]|uniref:DUF4238 domain-containing protein n=1 Tax=Agromyces sp. ZXT2-6 TaxID=3461153 RepID=UPI004054B1B4
MIQFEIATAATRTARRDTRRLKLAGDSPRDSLEARLLSTSHHADCEDDRPGDSRCGNEQDDCGGDEQLGFKTPRHFIPSSGRVTYWRRQRIAYLELRGGAAMNVKRAHMVSKGYIRAWADARGRVDVLDVQHGRGFPSAIENATVVSYAYDTEVLTHDLESDYARIEASGIPAILKLRNGHTTLTPAEQSAMIAFLDMHLDRGRYADQTTIRTPAVLLRTGGWIEDAELNLGDRLLLSQSLRDVIRLTALGLEQWPWQVREAQHLATGDGAVLLWRPTDGADISTISFPLSPTKLLVIGQDLPDDVRLNTLLAMNSRRWIVGLLGTLNLDQAAVIAARRSAG